MRTFRIKKTKTKIVRPILAIAKPHRILSSREPLKIYKIMTTSFAGRLPWSVMVTGLAKNSTDHGLGLTGSPLSTTPLHRDARSSTVFPSSFVPQVGRTRAYNASGTHNRVGIHNVTTRNKYLHNNSMILLLLLWMTITGST